MRSQQQEVRKYKELRHYGTPLDEMIFKKARTASFDLQITQSGNRQENCAYGSSAGVEIMVSLSLENVSDRIIKIDEIRLRMPWTDRDFHWIKRQSPTALNAWGGYVLPSCGPCGFDPSIVLNHSLTRSFKLYPADTIEGLLLGEGTAPVPTEFIDRMLVPMELLVFSSASQSYGIWVELGMSRNANKPSEVIPARAFTAAQQNKVEHRLGR